MLRTALWPLSDLLDWTAAIRSGALETGAAERATFHGGLSRRFDHPVTAEALFLGSPAAYEARQRAGAAPDAKLQRALGKYYSRMTGRATPFGIFAGLSVLRIAGPHQSLKVAAATDSERLIRLDHDYLHALIDLICGRATARNHLAYVPNSSLYRIAGRWRYVRTSTQHGLRQHMLMSVDADDFLQVVVTSAAGGAKLESLAGAVSRADPDGEITADEATQYVTELVERQILVPDLSLPVTGPDALSATIASLGELPEWAETRATLAAVQEALEVLRSAPLGCDPDRYRAIQSMLAPIGIEPDISRLFQVDLHRPAPAATCSVETADAILDMVHVLHSVGPAPRQEAWRRFKDAFTTRYEAREVPLTEVLDPDSGIGFDSADTSDWVPLLQGLHLGESEAAQPVWTPRDTLLLRLSESARHGRTEELRLTPQDLEELRNPSALPLPNAFSVTCVISKASGRPDKEAEILFRTTNGPSGANLLGRFCQGNDDLAGAVRAHLREEEQVEPGAVFAEIVHLPEGRIANVIARPLFREFEIPYLGRSGVDRSKQIPLSDLVVSVEQGRVVLRSAQHGWEIIPRKSNAHNHTRGQTIYRFLAALAHQDITPWVAWSWGALETACAYLPRVTFGRFVLARRRWRVESADLVGLGARDRKAEAERVSAWRDEHRIPRFVLISEADNELIIDLDNPVMVGVLLHHAKKRPTIVLFELFPEPDRLAAHSNDGELVSELVIPFVRQTEARKAVVRPRQAKPVDRVFLPGSGWLFTKWYAGQAGVDRLLGVVVPPLVRLHDTTYPGVPWFFLRYSDPEWHLRVRFAMPTAGLRGPLVEALLEASESARASGELWRFQFDTYQREVERYGGEHAIALAETVFWRDSTAALETLALLPGDAGVDVRWRACLKAWDMTLDSFQMSVEAKREFARHALNDLARQIRPSKPVERILGDRFRIRRKSLEQLLGDGGDGTPALVAVTACLRKRNQQLEGTMHDLRRLDATGVLRTSMPNLAAQFLHMTANRLLRSEHRRQEFLLYDMLVRLYVSQCARAASVGSGR